VRVADRAAARLPDAARAAPRRRVERSGGLERRGVVGEDPAVVIALVGVRREREVDLAVRQEQAGALVLVLALERDRPAAGLLGGRRDDLLAVRGPELSRGDIEGEQAMMELTAPLDHGHHEHRPRRQGDDRSADDADLDLEVAVFVPLAMCGIARGDVGDEGGGRERRAEVGMPERHRCGRVVGIESIDAVVHRRDEHDVVPGAVGHRHPGHIKGLGVDVTIHSPGEQLAEFLRGHVRMVQDCLVESGPGAGLAVGLGRHRCLRLRRRAKQEGQGYAGHRGRRLIHERRS